ncbi:uncharacterized protein LY89DRAFT_768202 [Mollisia scopiformis]|uniref:2EXR domain-containing protein n=1 Tax=Mollisia scopiformis TaxID=149040 RepID=A0A194XP66_MOLSC|nr:uncharacterized protein LY89DRAFT_768202 [Mollisia scopiformis]KUJ21956.1 hypothetical protein LY89DRAFT_768202 [Mollisia scopiformis]
MEPIPAKSTDPAIPREHEELAFSGDRSANTTTITETFKSTAELLEDPTPPGPFELAIKRLPKDLLKPFNATSFETKNADDDKFFPSTDHNTPTIVPNSLDFLSADAAGFGPPFSGPFGESTSFPKTSIKKPTIVTSLTISDQGTFPRFRSFPVELKLKIWNHAIADITPRLVTLAPKSGKVPALLHTCRLARHATKKAYSSILDLGLRLGQRHGFEALVRYETDTVFLTAMKQTRGPGQNPLSHAMECYPNILLPIKKLAIKTRRFGDHDFCRTGINNFYFWDKLAVACPALVEITFDLKGMTYDYGDTLLTSPFAECFFRDSLEDSLEDERVKGRFLRLTVYTISGLDGPWKKSKKVRKCLITEDADR